MVIERNNENNSSSSQIFDAKEEIMQRNTNTNVIKENFIFNTMSTFFIAFFPILTIPYVARVLGPDGFGKVSFASSIVNFFVILASLGIPAYGLREIARVRNEQKKLNEVYSELFLLNFISTIFFSVLYLILILFTNKLTSDLELFILMGFTLFLNIFQIYWLFQGLENYKFIAISNFFVYLISIVLIYLFVKSENDYILYGIILTLPFLLLSIFFMLRSRKYVKLRFTKNISIFHLKATFWLYFLTFITNIYVYFDRAILGFLAGDTAVGLYTIPNQLVKFATLLVTSLGAVLIPRFSYYFKNNHITQFNQMAHFSLNFIYLLSLPAVTGVFLLAPEIIILFSGQQYVDSIILLQIMVPVIVFIGITNFIGNQILIPCGEER